MTIQLVYRLELVPLTSGAADEISAFWKNRSCKLIPNWNRMIAYTKSTVICSKDERNSVRSNKKIVASREILFCRLSRQLLMFRYKISVMNSKLFILFSPSVFQYFWIEILIFIPFCLQQWNYSEYKVSSRSVNIFVKIPSQICVQSVLSSVRSSLDKCISVWSLSISLENSWSLTVKFNFLFIDGNLGGVKKTFGSKSLICDWTEMNELRFFCCELVLWLAEKHSTVEAALSV